jgi:hypothetical protein
MAIEGQILEDSAESSTSGREFPLRFGKSLRVIFARRPRQPLVLLVHPEDQVVEK